MFYACTCFCNLCRLMDLVQTLDDYHQSSKKHYELVVIFFFFISITAKKPFLTYCSAQKTLRGQLARRAKSKTFNLIRLKNAVMQNIMPQSTNAIAVSWYDIFQESCSLFTCLYQSWCHNPVATVSLCLLTQNYQHACDLLMVLYP